MTTDAAVVVYKGAGVYGGGVGVYAGAGVGVYAGGGVYTGAGVYWSEGGVGDSTGEVGVGGRYEGELGAGYDVYLAYWLYSVVVYPESKD